jgi:hypothetical protein
MEGTGDRHAATGPWEDANRGTWCNGSTVLPNQTPRFQSTYAPFRLVAPTPLAIIDETPLALRRPSSSSHASDHPTSLH